MTPYEIIATILGVDALIISVVVAVITILRYIKNDRSK